MSNKARGDRGRCNASAVLIFLLGMGVQAKINPDISWLTAPIGFMCIVVLGFYFWTFVDDALSTKDGK